MVKAVFNNKNRQNNILIFLCWFVYSTSYLGRYSYNANINLIISDYGVSHAAAGLVATFFFLAYGIGQVVNGIFCRHYPKRYIIPFALTVSSVINLLVFKGIPFYAVKYLWLVNGFSLSFLWTSLIQTLSENMEVQNLQKSVVIMSTTVAVGNFAAYGLAGIFSKINCYKLLFPVSAAVMLFAAVMWFSSYPFMLNENQRDEKAKEVKSSPSSAKKLTFALFAIIVIFCFCSIVCNFIKDGLQTWMPSVLFDEFGFGDSNSIFLTMALNVFAIGGTFLAAKIYKKLNDFVILTSLLFLIAALFTAVILVFFRSSFIAVFVSFVAVVVLTNAINNVITSMAPLYLREQINTGMLSGILNGFCYFGTTLSSYGLGKVADSSGWYSVFVILFIASTVVLIIGIIYVVFLRKKISNVNIGY